MTNFDPISKIHHGNVLRTNDTQTSTCGDDKPYREISDHEHWSFKVRQKLVLCCDVFLVMRSALKKFRVGCTYSVLRSVSCKLKRSSGCELGRKNNYCRLPDQCRHLVRPVACSSGQHNAILDTDPACIRGGSVALRAGPFP